MFYFSIDNAKSGLFSTSDVSAVKELRAFLNKEGRYSKTYISKYAKSNVNVGTKTKVSSSRYHNKIKKGKVYKKNGFWQVRVYNNARHGHLIENGYYYTTVKKNGNRRLYKINGKFVFKNTNSYLADRFNTNIDSLIDKLLESGKGW